jgi:hypothetical protein
MAEIIWPLIERFGLPVAMLIIALITGARGIWVWRRELESVNADRTRERTEAETERARERADFAVRLRETEERAIRWETIAWEAVTTAKYAAEKAKPSR